MPLSADMLHPMPGQNRLIFLKNVITNPNILVGDYTYYDDPDAPEMFQTRNVLYHFPFIGDRLVIGKFCAIAARTTFIMNGGNHRLDGFTGYPFGIFGDEYRDALPESWPYRGDTVIGSDVWLGYDSLVMPGIKVGHGAIIAARAVVTKDVPPYSIVGGNPAREIRRRFDDQTAGDLLEIAWWDWPIEKIVRNLKAVCNSDLNALKLAK